MASLITSLLFAAVGLYIIFYLAGSIIGGFFGLSGFPSISEKIFLWRFKQFTKLLEEAIAAIENRKLTTATELLRESFCLEAGSIFLKEFEKINTHNFSVLNRIVSLHEDSDVHLQNLPIVEELLQSRYELMRAYIETLQMKSKFKKRDSEKQKSSPQWAYDEIESKLKDIHDKLNTNRTSIASQIDALFRALRESTDTSRIQYH